MTSAPMLKLRPAQLARLSDHRKAEFVRRAQLHAWQCWREECLEIGEAGVRRRIESAMNLAQRSDIQPEVDVIGLLDVFMLVGDGLPNLQWAKTILADQTLKPEVKVHQLRVRAVAELEHTPHAHSG